MNLIPVRSGGGMQVASNFIQIVLNQEDFGHEWYFLVSERSELETLLKEIAPDKFEAFPQSFLKRTLKERFYVPKLMTDGGFDIVYSYGPGLPNSPIPAVTRSAYSNLYFPEIDFWGNWPLRKKWFFELKDKFRLGTTLKADALVFENKAMRKRAIELFGYTTENTLFVQPSVSEFSGSDGGPLPERYVKPEKNLFTVLMLTGWHKNKHIDLVPYILQEIGRAAPELINKVEILITVDPKHPYSIDLLETAETLGVADRIRLFGQVPVTEIPYIYGRSDIVLLLSKLECFSSNIIESWSFKKPLIISDEEWSRAICNEAVSYVNRDDARIVAEDIIRLVESKSDRDTLIEKGLKELEDYNTPFTKVKEQVEFIEKIAKLR